MIDALGVVAALLTAGVVLAAWLMRLHERRQELRLATAVRRALGEVSRRADAERARR